MAISWWWPQKSVSSTFPKLWFWPFLGRHSWQAGAVAGRKENCASALGQFRLLGRNGTAKVDALTVLGPVSKHSGQARHISLLFRGQGSSHPKKHTPSVKQFSERRFHYLISTRLVDLYVPVITTLWTCEQILKPCQREQSSQTFSVCVVLEPLQHLRTGGVWTPTQVLPVACSTLSKLWKI